MLGGLEKTQFVRPSALGSPGAWPGVRRAPFGPLTIDSRSGTPAASRPRPGQPRRCPVQHANVGVTLRHVRFSEELVHYATDRARHLLSQVPCLAGVEVLVQPCRSGSRNRQMFEVHVDAYRDGRVGGLHHRGAGLFLAVRDAFATLQTQFTGEHVERAGCVAQA